MRTVFPALHHRTLSAILVGVALLFLGTLVAIAMGGLGDEPQVEESGPRLFLTGATPTTS